MVIGGKRELFFPQGIHQSVDGLLLVRLDRPRAAQACQGRFIFRKDLCGIDPGQKIEIECSHGGSSFVFWFHFVISVYRKKTNLKRGVMLGNLDPMTGLCYHRIQHKAS